MRSRKASAYIQPARRAMVCAERHRPQDVTWRRVPGPFWGADETSEEAVEGWATAESSATGCGADSDRMTSAHSRSSSVSRWWHWIRAWGSGEPATNDPAARASDGPVALARSRVGRTSQPFTMVALTVLVRAGAGPWPDRRCHALGESECCV